jgi:pimeloyl-ACP methyl ester carboxylesterase
MPTFAVNGTHLSYTITRNAGPPLVLVHGSWADHRDWELVIPGFAQNHRVLAYDRRGHSRSEHEPTVDGIAADVVNLASMIETLDLTPAHVVGLSAGGCIALQLAGQRPELVRSLSVHEPPLVGLVAGDAEHGPLMQDVIARIEGVVARLEAGDGEGGARLFVESLVLGPGAWEMIPPEWRRHMVDNAATFLSDARDPALLTVDLASLAMTAIPTLLTSGNQSPGWFAQIMSALEAGLPHASRYRFDGAGHLPMKTHVDEYVATLTAFFATPDAVPAVSPEVRANAV